MAEPTESLDFFDAREAGRFPSLGEAMEAVEALRADGISATFLESPAGPPEPGAPCPAAVLVEDPADRPRAREILGRQAAVEGASRQKGRLGAEIGLVLLVAWLPARFGGIAAYIWPLILAHLAWNLLVTW